MRMDCNIVAQSIIMPTLSSPETKRALHHRIFPYIRHKMIEDVDGK